MALMISLWRAPEDVWTVCGIFVLKGHRTEAKRYDLPEAGLQSCKHVYNCRLRLHVARASHRSPCYLLAACYFRPG